MGLMQLHLNSRDRAVLSD